MKNFFYCFSNNSLKKLIFTIMFAYLHFQNYVNFHKLAIYADDTIARFTDLHGEVLIRPDAIDDAWEQAELDSIIKINDHVKTGNNSTAILGFLDLSTLILKSNTEIIVTSPTANTNSIKILFGNIWINVKKVLSDQSFEVEMSQAVAGIKGTNFTCKTSKNEDLVQVLRGEVEVLLKATKEKITLKEGEELLIKKGGKYTKREISIDKIQNDWANELENLGSSINLDNIESTIKKMIEDDEQLFQKIKLNYDELINSIQKLENPATRIREISKLCDITLGILFEHIKILDNIIKRLNKHVENLKEKKDLKDLQAKNKILSDGLKKLNSFKADITKILTSLSRIISTKQNLEAIEISSLKQNLDEVIQDFSTIERELSLKPHGLSQDWFLFAAERCKKILTNLNNLNDIISRRLPQISYDKEAIQLGRIVSTYISKVNNFLRTLSVVPISREVLVEMQQTDDVLSNLVLTINKEIEIYNKITKDQSQARLKSTLNILREFSKARRLYNNSQRLYDSIMREVSRQKYITAEQLELKNIYQRIQDSYQQLAINVNILESKLNELESQLKDILNNR